jgi:uncharacterized protein
LTTLLVMLTQNRHFNLTPREVVAVQPFIDILKESSMTINPTQTERLILINQLEILQKLKPDDADWYADKIKILTNGYTIFYGEIDKCIYEEMSEEDCKEVINILEMFTFLTRTYEKLNQPNVVNKLFAGFDGNYETDQMGFAHFLIEEQNKFKELKKKNGAYDSHAPMLPKYRAMLEVWKTIPETERISGNISEVDLLRITEAEVKQKINVNIFTNKIQTVC